MHNYALIQTRAIDNRSKIGTPACIPVFTFIDDKFRFPVSRTG